MIKFGQIFAGNTRNAFIEKIQFSLAFQTFIRSKASEATRNSNQKCLSSIRITNLNKSTEFSSIHYVTNLNKSTHANDTSSIISIDKKGQHYSKEEDKKLLDYVNKYGKSLSTLKSLSKDLGRTYVSIRQRIRRLESANEYETNNERRAWEIEDNNKLMYYIFFWFFSENDKCGKFLH